MKGNKTGMPCAADCKNLGGHSGGKKAAAVNKVKKMGRKKVGLYS